MYECFNPLTPKLYSFQTTFSIFMPTTHHIFISVQAAIISRLGGGSGGPSHQDDTFDQRSTSTEMEDWESLIAELLHVMRRQARRSNPHRP